MEPETEAQKGNRGHFLPSLLIKASVAVGLAAIFLVSPPTTRDASGWDSIFGTWMSSHDAITSAAIQDILDDPTADEGLKQWLRDATWPAPLPLLSYNIITAYAGGNPSPTEPHQFGEVIHGVQRPLDPVALDCAPGEWMGFPVTDPTLPNWGPARWAVGNNPGTNHPEYWWQTAVCLWRQEDYQDAYAALGRMIHAIEDQSSLPHAYYHEHGFPEGFEVLSATTSFDTSYYRFPFSTYSPGKAVIDKGSHGDIPIVNDDRYTTFPIAKRAADYWVPIDLAPRDPNTWAANLQVPGATSCPDPPDPALPPCGLVIETAVAEPWALPNITLHVEYYRPDGTGGTAEFDSSLKVWPWEQHVIIDNFGPNSTVRVWYKRTEGCPWLPFASRTWCLLSSTGQIRLFVTHTQDVVGGGEIVKPQLAHPWEYYDWLREWTWWAAQAPYWRRYYPSAGGVGDLDFDWTWLTAPNAERAMLSLQWRVTEQVVRWVLEDAWTRLEKEKDTYSTVNAGGQGYRVALYNDAYYNSKGTVSPEEIKSIAVACEPYWGDQPGRSATCGAFVPTSPLDQPPVFGDGIFAACGTGNKVTIKANDLGFMNKHVSSLEVRGATVSLFPGKNLAGSPVVITADTEDLGGFSDWAQSLRIVPPAATEPPLAVDDSFTLGRPDIHQQSEFTLDVLGNDLAGSAGERPKIVRVSQPPDGFVSVSPDGKTITYEPRLWGTESFTYEINDPIDGDCDVATVTVTVNGGNQAPTDVVVDSESQQAEEGRPFTVAGGFLDVDYSDTHSVVVDWGDGTPPTEIALPAGELSFTADHIYIDNNPPATPTYTVTAVVTDPAGASAGGSTSVVVVNVAPELANLTAGPFDEASVGTLSGTIVDPGALDSFVMAVDWADGTAVQSIPYPAGTTGFSLQHTYADDNPTGTPSDTYAVSMTVTDKDGGMGSASVPAVVNNVPPVASIDSIHQAGLEIGTDVDIALTNTPVEVAGSFIDVGTLDTHTASIDWGDGNVDGLGAVTGSLSAAHTYTTPCDCAITLTVTDDDTGVDTATRVIEVVDAAGAIIHVSEDLAAFSGNRNVLRALGRLIGEEGGLANNGAVDLLEDNPVAALYMMKLALWYLEAAEGGDPSLNFAKQEALLALAARSETIDAIEDAEAIALAPNDLRKIAEARTLLARGDELRSASDYVNAVNKYWLAVRSVVGIR